MKRTEKHKNAVNPWEHGNNVNDTIIISVSKVENKFALLLKKNLSLMFPWHPLYCNALEKITEPILYMMNKLCVSDAEQSEFSESIFQKLDKQNRIW